MSQAKALPALGASPTGKYYLGFRVRVAIMIRIWKMRYILRVLAILRLWVVPAV